jgi:hypothetical protein
MGFRVGKCKAALLGVCGRLTLAMVVDKVDHLAHCKIVFSLQKLGNHGFVTFCADIHGSVRPIVKQ